MLLRWCERLSVHLSHIHPYTHPPAAQGTPQPKHRPWRPYPTNHASRIPRERERERERFLVLGNLGSRWSLLKYQSVLGVLPGLPWLGYWTGRTSAQSPQRGTVSACRYTIPCNPDGERPASRDHSKYPGVAMTHHGHLVPASLAAPATQGREGGKFDPALG